MRVNTHSTDLDITIIRWVQNILYPIKIFLSSLDLPLFSQREITFMTSCLLICTPSKIESTLEKRICSPGGNSFLLDKISDDKETKTLLKELPPLQVYLFPLKYSNVFVFCS